jgi:SOS-response transcriptional repressor LexA
MLGDGIRHGETLSALPVDTVEEGRIAVFSTPHGLTLKRGYAGADGTVILRASNPTYPDQRWLANQVRVVAVIDHAGLSAKWN